MKNIFSFEKKSKICNLDSNLIIRLCKLDFTAKCMVIKSLNPKIGQNKIAKDFSSSTSTLQRYRHYINILSPYRIPSTSHKRRQKVSNTNLDTDSHREPDVRRLQMTAKDLKRLNSLNFSQMRPLR